MAAQRLDRRHSRSCCYLSTLCIEICCLYSWAVVMGSIEENRYRYSVDTLAKVLIVSILVSVFRYPSENPHYELHIHKLVTYFDFRTSNFLGFFAICPICAVSGYFQIRFFFFAFLVTIPVTIPSIDT